ncbi:hypothetical protein KC356_g142 [Hortaea werneckii]|nr:hypothetical protein KC356_g142 [Hortaea werneckii]
MSLFSKSRPTQQLNSVTADTHAPALQLRPPQSRVRYPGQSHSRAIGGGGGKIITDLMTDNNLLNQLKLVHRTSTSRHSVCTFYKTLPPTPAPEIDCFVSIIFCSRLDKDPDGGYFDLKSILLEQRLLVGLPPGCNYWKAMGVIEARAMAILDKGKSKPGGANDVCMGKLWRTEILLGREADGWSGDVEISDAIWDDTLMKLEKDGDKCEIVVVFHEPQVPKKKHQRPRGRRAVL